MKNNHVQQHSLTEVMALLGERPPVDGLHVIEQQEPVQVKPIPYPFRADHFSVILITAGEALIRINLTDYHTRKNGILIIAPHAIRHFLESSPDCMFTGIAFTAGFLSDAGMNLKHAALLDFFSSNNTRSYFEPAQTDTDRLLGLLRFILHKKKKADPSLADLEVIHHSFLAWIYELSTIHQRYNGISQIKLTKKEDLTMRFSQLLSGDFKAGRSVLHYAGLLCVSPKYLSQAVKEVTNKTAGELIDEMVIMEAKVLLNNLSLSIAQVAETLYFSDQFFFSKFFKKHTGLTPSEYRKTR